jgi:hypothetical protein
MHALSNRLSAINGRIVVAGDTKGPNSYDLPNTIFLSYEAQLNSGYSLAKKLPTKHYARKNIAYLEAIYQGAQCIYETDDDNKPNNKWNIRNEFLTNCKSVARDKGWVNVYKYFTNELIWPRGIPLNCIRSSELLPLSDLKESQRCPIQQGLVNNSPDVDAIWRLVFDRPFYFDPDKHESIYIRPGSWCPFNTQSTWWWPIAYPLLYIPSYCSFRMCDIWKSFVAQRCLWELDMGIAFHPAEVIQDRNEHDLTKDFEDEISGYLYNSNIKKILENCHLHAGSEFLFENLKLCYVALVDAGIFPNDELTLVDSWISDCRQAMKLSKI